MKKIYQQPEIYVVTLNPLDTMLTTSFGGGVEGTEIEEEPGNVDDYA